jgi:steroid 5-alpha reductase family enzyme
MKPTQMTVSQRGYLKQSRVNFAWAGAMGAIAATLALLGLWTGVAPALVFCLFSLYMGFRLRDWSRE